MNNFLGRDDFLEYSVISLNAPSLIDYQDNRLKMKISGTAISAGGTPGR